MVDYDLACIGVGDREAEYSLGLFDITDNGPAFNTIALSNDWALDWQRIKGDGSRCKNKRAAVRLGLF